MSDVHTRRDGHTGRDNDTWVRLLGSAGTDEWDVAITDEIEGWEHTGLHVATLVAGESRALATGSREYVVVPLNGGCRVDVTDAEGERQTVDLAGRESVFAGACDVVYVPREADLVVTAAGDGTRVALASATATKADAPKPVRVIRAHDVPVELRGAGIASREVRSFGLPDVLDADSILVCEVITPAGNWSSWPPHKHDTERPGEETRLEEIYYFEARSIDPRGTRPVGYQQVYAADESRPVDVLTEVRTGDVVLVPHGWHGPAMAAPDADLYYLNVMAGPGPERAWLICDDPAHAWVRETWADLPVDPRLAGLMGEQPDGRTQLMEGQG